MVYCDYEESITSKFPTYPAQGVTLLSKAMGEYQRLKFFIAIKELFSKCRLVFDWDRQEPVASL